MSESTKAERDGPDRERINWLTRWAHDKFSALSATKVSGLELRWLLNRAEAAEDALRSLACWLGVGGYNPPTVDAATFERKIRAGVDDLIRVETARARGPQISDSEETALLRRVNKEFQDRAEAAEAERDRLAARVRELENELMTEGGVLDIRRQSRRDALAECERIAHKNGDRDTASAIDAKIAELDAVALREGEGK